MSVEIVSEFPSSFPHSSGQQTQAPLLVAVDASKPVFLYTHLPLELLSIVIFQLTSCKDIGQVGVCVCSSRFTCHRLCGLQTDFFEGHRWLESGIVSDLLIALLSLVLATILPSSNSINTSLLKHRQHGKPIRWLPAHSPDAEYEEDIRVLEYNAGAGVAAFFSLDAFSRTARRSGESVQSLMVMTETAISEANGAGLWVCELRDCFLTAVPLSADGKRRVSSSLVLFGGSDMIWSLTFGCRCPPGS
jgi:hypothetical protein